jgi:hypothetical protein
VATYPLRGGPCDGRRSADYATEPRDQTIIACGGASYVYSRSNPGVFVWLDVGAGAGSATSGQIHPRQVVQAWSRLMHAYGVTTPRQLRRVAAARKRMRRAVR